ncbi:MAG: phosphatase PAP2 family protein [Dehalococcoidia bacterium]
MAVRTFPAPRTPAALSFPGAARAATFGRDFGIVLVVVGAYFLVRGIAPTRVDFAVTVTDVLISIEKNMGIFWEAQIQEMSIRYHAVQEVANFTYAYLHFPVLIVVGAGLWFKDRQSFTFMRNVMFISMAIGIVFYYLLPAAPPRLLELHGTDLGFTDTVFGGDTSVQYAQPSMIMNEYAAIPSFHFGWIAMASAAIWVNTESRLLRTAAVALTVLMSWAIVASANHLFLDMAIGGAVIALAWWAATKIEARASRPAPREPIAMRRGVDELDLAA